MAGFGVWYGRLVRGEIAGIGAALLRGVLSIAAWFYGLIIAVRNRMYDAGWLKVRQLEVPVICVGNITAGGTGKTPMVVWMCRYLQQKGFKPVVLSRGYKGSQYAESDEVQLLRLLLPGVVVIADSDRVCGGQRAVKQYGANILVMDDGFQHRRVARNLDIVMVDSTEPFGLGKMLPRGFLREPVSSLKRAGAIVLSRLEMSDANQRSELVRKILHITGNRGGVGTKDAELLVVCSYTKAVSLLSVEERDVSLAELRGKDIAVFCGIGNPQAFVAMLKNLGAKVVTRCFWDDHFAYDENSCRKVADMARHAGVEMIVTTEKDWIKLKWIQKIRDVHNLYRLRVETKIGDGKEKLCRLIDKTIMQ